MGDLVLLEIIPGAESGGWYVLILKMIFQHDMAQVTDLGALLQSPSNAGHNCFTAGVGEEVLAPVSCWTKVSQLDLTESAEIFSSWDRMAGRALTCSAGEFKQWQQAAGITWSPEAVLADKTLRPVLDPIKQYFHDFMHCLMATGAVSTLCWNKWQAGLLDQCGHTLH